MGLSDPETLPTSIPEEKRDFISWPALLDVSSMRAPESVDESVWEETHVTLKSVAQATLIFAIGLAIVVSNLFVIAAYYNFKGLVHQVIDHYLLSLAVADLICGLFIVPLSVYPAITGVWMHGDFVCRLAGYIEVTLWCVSVYTFMWISVDRYQAVRKPLRYETVSSTIQTRTRSQCWMVFTWVSAAMLCCPPLLGYRKEANFDDKTLICMLDWGTTTAYTMTLAILVMGPSVISMVYNYLYIICMKRKLYRGVPNHDKEYVTALAENLSNPSHWMSFILVVTFWLSWAPYAGVRFYEYCIGHELDIPMLHFVAVWIGILNSFWKILVILPLSPQFRLAFRLLCKCIFCRSTRRLKQNELMSMDNEE